MRCAFVGLGFALVLRGQTAFSLLYWVGGKGPNTKVKKRSGHARLGLHF